MTQTFMHYLDNRYKNPKTIRGYMNDIEVFTLFLEKENISIEQIKETHIKKFNLYLREQHYSAHSIARKNSALRTYFKFLRKEGVMLHNPMEDIQQPKCIAREENLTSLDVQTICSSDTPLRHQVLFLLAYYDKLKMKEIVSLQKENYNPSEGVLYTRHKALVVHEQTKRCLEQLYKEIDSYFVTNQHGKPLSEAGAYFICKQYFEKIGKPTLRPIDLYKKQSD